MAEPKHIIKIKSLQLRDFRQFAFLDVPIHQDEKVKDLLVFIANNGGGKTTVLDAMGICIELLLKDLGIITWKVHDNEEIREKWKKAVKNGTSASLLEAKFEVTYQAPVYAYQMAQEIANVLNDFEQEGYRGIFHRDLIDGNYNIHITQLIEDKEGSKEEDLDTFGYTPSEIFLAHMDVENISDIEISVRNTAKDSVDSPKWEPDLEALRKSMQSFVSSEQDKGKNWVTKILKLNIEIKEDGQVELKHKNITEEEALDPKGTKARLEDIQYSLEMHREVSSTPLFAYYGGNSLSAKIKGSYGIGKAKKKGVEDAYKDALDPQAFDFSAFYIWYNELYKTQLQGSVKGLRASFEAEYQRKQEHANQEWEAMESIIGKTQTKGILLERIDHLILGALNADEEGTYSDFGFAYENGENKLRLAKGEDTVEVGQLSGGEKNLMALVADLAMRLALLDPEGDFWLGEGIVLIDEIDLHLHPKWQRIILPYLRENFPYIQFLVTTHSPFVVQSNVGQLVSLPDGYLSKVGAYTLDNLIELMGGNPNGVEYERKDWEFYEAFRDEDLEKLEEAYNWLKVNANPNSPRFHAYQMNFEFLMAGKI